MCYFPSSCNHCTDACIADRYSICAGVTSAVACVAGIELSAKLVKCERQCYRRQLHVNAMPASCSCSTSCSAHIPQDGCSVWAVATNGAMQRFFCLLQLKFQPQSVSASMKVVQWPRACSCCTKWRIFCYCYYRYYR